MTRDSKLCLWFIVVSLFIGTLGISNQSLWIDERQSAAKAMQPSLSSWWTKMAQDKGSDLQMPFYMFCAWGEIFGPSEYALRASSIPWFAVAALAMTSIFPKKARLQFSVLMLTLTNAFLW